ncbi:MAG: C40 family peptidase [Defluviitaleaceae bacterium]|nr:C40 family peptidase [Defluviitaleaceae bacterium]
MRRTILLSFLFTIFMTVAAYAANTYGVVTGTLVNVREEAELSDNIKFRVEQGTPVVIAGVSGDFFRVDADEASDVYIAREFVRVTSASGVITSPFALVYDITDEHSTAFSTLRYGDIVPVVSTHDEFFGIEFRGTLAFVEKGTMYVPEFVELPVARIGTRFADAVIETALAYIGTPYVWGGTTPRGFDCSGFMQYIFAAHGMNLSRTSRDQVRHGVAVPRSELERGDLVFFGSGNHINHVGLYIGNGDFVHSSSHRTAGVRICNLYEPHNVRGFVTARRII